LHVLDSLTRYTPQLVQVGGDTQVYEFVTVADCVGPLMVAVWLSGGCCCQVQI